MIANGKSVPKDEALAVALYKQSCDGGEAHGCFDLGTMYEVGAGVARDPARATGLYKQACDGGDSEACSKLAP